MPIALDPLIVNVRDQVASARFLAELLAVPWEAARGPFSPVYVNDALTLDFIASDVAERQHYCFRVGEGEFDAILGRVKASGTPYRSMPHGPDDSKINTRLGGRNVYWNDADGHVWEILTVSYARRDAAPVG